MPERDTMAFRWTGAGFVPTDRFVERAQEKFSPGAVYWLSVEPERSDKTHNHEFAFVAEAWKNLPDEIAHEYPTAEHLRKRALIRTGFCTMQDYVCTSHAEALRWAENLRRELDAYTLITINGPVIRVHRAMSQSRQAMKGPEFQRSKTAILEWISNLLGVEPGQLLQAKAA